ncbi:MAG: YicC family protein, partial [Gemmatimonadales bacterium]
ALPGEIDLQMVVRQPEVITTPAPEDIQIGWPELEAIVREAGEQCRAMRRREGDVLAQELGYRLDLLDQGRRGVADLAPGRLVRERDRLRASVAQLLDGRPIDDQRLAQELAFIADKLDITEELVRLESHVVACRQALAGDAPVGKHLGFLAQEMGREVNTIGSKANDAEIAGLVIGMKGELERFREQIENLE